jgi:hypothetical protein
MIQSDRIIFNGSRINIHLFSSDYPLVEVQDAGLQSQSEFHDLSIKIPGLTNEENTWVSSKFSFIASWMEKGI